MIKRPEPNTITRHSKDFIGRLCEAPERHPGRTIIAIGLVFALAYGASLVLMPKADGRIVVGDALHEAHLARVVAHRELVQQQAMDRAILGADLDLVGGLLLAAQGALGVLHRGDVHRMIGEHGRVVRAVLRR